MKNKSKVTFFALLLSALLTMSACQRGGGTSDSESKESESTVTSDQSEEGSESIEESEESLEPSEPASEESETETSESEESLVSESVQAGHKVQFVVEGVVVQESTVEDGELATFDGDMPTKAKGDSEIGYVFKSWDRDLFEPITEDTIFTALFSEYVSELMIDDFEDYEDSGSMKDEGWVALGYNETTKTWTTDTSASVSLGYKSVEGKRALRFDAWENGVGYKFAQIYEKDKTFDQAANALRFRLMVPKINSVSVILHAAATIQGKLQAPTFTYRMKPSSSEYVEYTIPLADPGWCLWGEEGKSIASVATWSGIHQDTIFNYLTRIEFYVQGNDGHSWPYLGFLDSISFVTLDDPANTEVEDMEAYGVYTGTLADGHILRIDMGANNTAIAKVIDVETPIEISGKIDIDGRDITFTSDDKETLTYNGRMINNGKLIEYVSASGTYKKAVEDMDLNAVQTVDNFEQYEDNGLGYSKENKKKNNLSGIRGAFYSEMYTGSGASDWSGTGWELTPKGDEVNLITDAEQSHGGSKYGSFKHYGQNAIRYMQWDLFNKQGDKNSFRGETLSFWAKGFVGYLKVYVYSQSKPEHSTMDSRVKIGQFGEGSNVTEWTHLEVSLNPELVYYGFMFTIEKDYAQDKDLFIDDIEVYAANPYAEYEEPLPEPAREISKGMTFTGKINGTIAAHLDVKAENAVKLSAHGLGISADGTYEVGEEGETTLKFGDTTYVGTLSEDRRNIEYKSVSGSDIVATGLKNLNFEASEVLENAESYDEAGLMYYQGNQNERNAYGARAAYYCDYKPGGGTSPVGGAGWTLMGGTGNQLDLDLTQGYEGNQSLTFKRSSGYDLRYMQWELYKGTARARTGVNKFVMYFKNTNNDAITLDLYVFTCQKLDSKSVVNDRVEKEFTIKANSEWVKCEVKLDVSKTYYGYGVFTHVGGSNININGDYAYFAGPNSGPELNFFAKKGLVLVDSTTGNEASLTFGDDGKLVFFDPTSGDEVEGAYEMVMGETAQEMIIEIDGTEVRGTYSVDATGKVTFKVIEATGDYDTSFPVDAVFGN